MFARQNPPVFQTEKAETMSEKFSQKRDVSKKHVHLKAVAPLNFCQEEAHQWLQTEAAYKAAQKPHYLLSCSLKVSKFCTYVNVGILKKLFLLKFKLLKELIKLCDFGQRVQALKCIQVKTILNILFYFIFLKVLISTNKSGENCQEVRGQRS